MPGWKPRTSATTDTELEAAMAAREEQEKRDAAELQAAKEARLRETALGTITRKSLSMSASAIKKREKTKLTQAWDHKVQVEASKKLAELFPNRDGITIDLTDEPEPELPAGADEDAGHLGVPFTEPEHDEEWEEWVDWSAVGA